ncbi:MAG: hydrogenase expression/formation protein [Candidatus Lokiarchaeota archaeon]|nr:hydrogenase expression/formation protein [Candidatus Lokiarchaeota archaeon]
MRLKNSPFSIGKLNHNLLEKMLKNFVSDLEINDKRVITGSRIGEDAAVIDMKNGKYMVVKMDPITFATQEIGYYAVHVNVNDLVCTGAEPKWFQCTILLPEGKTSENMIENIFKSIHDTCNSMGITIVGGHTEVTSELNRPIVIGSLIGEVDKENLVNTSGAQIGDDIILTKGVFIEGTSIIAREKEEELKNNGFESSFIERCKSYLFDPGISVYKEALLSNENFSINSMHDPTEGGLACGIAEVAIASNSGVLVFEDKISVLAEPLELSKVYGLNPIGTISSGSLLITVSGENSADLVNLLRKNKISAEIIGKITQKKEGLKMKTKDGIIKNLNYSETDEITKIFEKSS